MKKEFKFEVSANEIKTVKDILEKGKINLSNDSDYILGAIFSNKICKSMGDFSWRYGLIRVTKDIVVKVEGTSTFERIDKARRKKLTEEVPTTVEITVQMIPVQFENFFLDGNKVHFIMAVNNEEWRDTTIIERIPEKAIKHIHNPRYSIEFPVEGIKTDEYWENIFKDIESKISAEEDINTLIKWTFDVLKLKGMFPIYGRDVLEVRKMYYYCMEHFPIFAKMPLDRRLEYLNNGIEKAKRNRLKIESDSLLHSYTLAKYILDELINNDVVNDYDNCKIDRIYYKKNPSSDIEDIRYISYIKPDGRRISYSPFSIWYEMAGLSDEDFSDVSDAS